MEELSTCVCSHSYVVIDIAHPQQCSCYLLVIRFIVQSSYIFLLSVSGQATFVYISPHASLGVTGSSSFLTFAEQNITAVSGLAVDKILNGNFSDGSCFHSDIGDTSPLWYLDMTENYEVFSVVIKNRADCCGKKLFPFNLEIK